MILPHRSLRIALQHAINTHELTKVMARLPRNSAVLASGIHNRLVGKLPDHFIWLIVQLIRLSFASSRLPAAWKRAIIAMLLKFETELHEPSNYRPISLLGCLGKLCERVVHGCLYDHLEAPHQWVFHNHISPFSTYAQRKRIVKRTPRLEKWLGRNRLEMNVSKTYIYTILTRSNKMVHAFTKTCKALIGSGLDYLALIVPCLSEPLRVSLQAIHNKTMHIIYKKSYDNHLDEFGQLSGCSHATSSFTRLPYAHIAAATRHINPLLLSLIRDFNSQNDAQKQSNTINSLQNSFSHTHI